MANDPKQEFRDYNDLSEIPGSKRGRSDQSQSAKFGSWTQIGSVLRKRKPSGGWRYAARMRCECGTEKLVDIHHAKTGNSTNCGCNRARIMRTIAITHGQSRSVIYRVWKGMRERCQQSKHVAFARYGGRGITVCDEWLDFRKFSEWAIANGWRQGLQIDRIDGNGNYSPKNCRIVTPKQQARNSSRNRVLTAFGESKCMVEWSEDSRCAVNYQILRSRLLRGWDIELALLTKKLRRSRT